MNRRRSKVSFERKNTVNKSTVVTALAVLALICPCVCGDEESAVSPESPRPGDVEKVVAGGNEFAFEMYQELAGDGDGNLFFSPANIHTALAMTYGGARGRTAEQMAEVLHFKLPQAKIHPAYGQIIKSLNSPRTIPVHVRSGRMLRIKRVPAYKLLVVNALWGQKGYPWKDAFLTLTRKNYGAGLRHVDFIKETEAARKTINDWVEKQTRNKIKKLIAPGVLNEETRMVLTNAVYFKSQWAHQFGKEATKDGTFHITGDKSVETAMMHQQERFGYMENDDFQALEMPYKARDLSMIVLLPRKVDGLDELEKKLSGENLKKWLGKMRPREVKVAFPKFEFTSKFTLAEKLAEMGMNEAFSAQKADFSGMATVEQLFLSAVIHKAFVAVDEEGTEAAAATAVVMTATAMPVKPPKPKIFKADHPFIFLIRHNATGSILFAGRVTNPKGE